MQVRALTADTVHPTVEQYSLDLEYHDNCTYHVPNEQADELAELGTVLELREVNIPRPIKILYSLATRTRVLRDRLRSENFYSILPQEKL
jgi:hypothetical protein